MAVVAVVLIAVLIAVIQFASHGVATVVVAG